MMTSSNGNIFKPMIDLQRDPPKGEYRVGSHPEISVKDLNK